MSNRDKQTFFNYLAYCAFLFSITALIIGIFNLAQLKKFSTHSQKKEAADKSKADILPLAPHKNISVLNTKKKNKKMNEKKKPRAYKKVSRPPIEKNEKNQIDNNKKNEQETLIRKERKRGLDEIIPDLVKTVTDD